MSTPGKDHLHHRLLAWGFSQRRAAYTLWSITLVFNLLAMRTQHLTLVQMVATTISVIFLIGFTICGRIRKTEYIS
jgi:UDP-GlcNAc:undecaprenyl-phosphate GlcNAc-1-phosphate transferase